MSDGEIIPPRVEAAMSLIDTLCALHRPRSCATAIISIAWLPKELRAYNAALETVALYVSGENDFSDEAEKSADDSAEDAQGADQEITP